MGTRLAHRLFAQFAISTLVGVTATVGLSASATAGTGCTGVAIATDPADSVTLTSEGHVCIFAYDATVSVTGQTNAAIQLGEPGATAFAYDAQGRLISDTGADATTTMYDARGQLISDTQSSNTTSYSYDLHGHLIETVDPLVGTTTYVYDTAGRLISSANVDGASTQTTDYAYNSSDDLISTTDSNGLTVHYVYDAQNRVVEVTEMNGAAGRTTSYMYDPAGSVTSTTDSIDGTTRYSYDSADQIISDTDPLGHVTTYSYDAAGNMLSEMDAGGKTDFIYTSPVPEPATWSILLFGLGALGLLLRSRRRQSIALESP